MVTLPGRRKEKCGAGKKSDTRKEAGATPGDEPKEIGV